MNEPNEPKGIEARGKPQPQPEPSPVEKPKKTLRDAMANAASGLCLGPEDMESCEEAVKRYQNAHKKL